MRIINNSNHGVLDLVTVAIFALAPSVVGLDGGAATLSYLLAAVHLVMTLLTSGIPVSIADIVPLPLHGMVEVLVGAGLGLIGWLAFDGTAQLFYLIMGIVIVAVFVLSNYGVSESPA